MKKIIPVFVLLLSALTAFSQTVTLTFTGRDASNQHLPMNRVSIANATQGWQETIYYPDTVFTMDGTGIADNAANGDFGLRQNNPNPFTGTTYATLQTMDAGEAILEMVDVNGRIVETWRAASLQPGTHQFRINVAAAGIYFLTARQNGQASSIKMVNNGQGATNRIEYRDFVNANNMVETRCTTSLQNNNSKGVATHPFALGDDMIYTGYVTVGGTEYQSQVIRQNQFVSEIFVLNFNVFSPMGFATVTTDAATNVGAFTATCGGNVTDDGGYSVIARGICWSTSPNPVFNDNHLSCGDSMGAFSGQLAGLDANTTYYVRAYAVNSVGTAYGEQVSFTTFGNGQPCPGAATVTDVDNNTYNTVRIGQQCWMKENLKTTHYADGTAIPLGSSSNTTTAYRYYPNNDSSNVSTYGYLYNWLAVMHNSASSDANPSGVQGICPTGWHVPSDAEWTQLTDYVSSQSEYVCGSNNTYIAKAFASTTGWSSSSNTCAVSNNLSANNATGFSAVPAGYYSDIYYSFGHLAYIWSATQYGSANAYCRDLGSAYAKVFRDYSTTDHGHSVRCLSDDGVSSETLPTVITNTITCMIENSATCGGNVTNDGGTSVIARGVCWSPSPNPTIADNHTTDGSGTGSFTSCITGLIETITYYVRAYATNSLGTAYGSQMVFTTVPVYLPIVTTDSVVNVTCSSATCDGNVIDDGGASVIARGVCWSTSQNPMVSDSHTTDGSGTGNFISSITGLTETTTYYVRAYATNEAGTSYGCQMSFTTMPVYLPIVTTDSVTNVTWSSATCGSNVTDDGGASVTARGVCWSTSQNPTVSDSHTTDGSGTGSFTSSMTSLTETTTYYVRAYATNKAGTSYGSQMSFTTEVNLDGQPCRRTVTVSDYDNNTYNTVRIGNQCWMKENMKTTHYADGTSISLGSSSSTSMAYRYYPNNDSSNVSTYGYLYNWKAVMGNSSSSLANPSGVQGICPNGWHVPSDAEWTQLTNYVSSQSEYVCGSNNTYIAKALADTTGWYSNSNTCAVGNNPTTNNVTGFSAVPASCYDGVYHHHLDIGYGMYFWSTTQYDYNAYGRNVLYYHAYVSRDNYNKGNGFSVRCLRDDGVQSETLPTVTTNIITYITANSATCGGNVTDDGGYSVTARGVCWSTSQNPTIADSHTTDGIGTGSYISSITGLTETTTYYVRAYATNETGTSYGNQESFTTESMPCPGAATVSDYDNNTYNTVKIGNQCWMKENLRTTHYADGTFISLGSITSTTTAYRYCPNNSSSNVSTYGYLYNWKAVMRNSSYSSANPSGVQGICPTGWHVPSDSEWTQLADYVSSQSQYVCGSNNAYIAKSLASTIGWSNSSNPCVPGNNLSSNNVTGFSVVPAGYYGGYSSFGNSAHFWSATQYNSSYAYDRDLVFDDADVNGNVSNKYYGYSVRCVRD